MNLNLKQIHGILLFVFSCAMLSAFNPPTGGDSANVFLAPQSLGGNTSVTGGALAPTLPGELPVNPSLGAAEQRIVLDASYGAIVGNKTDKGLGHFVNLGGLYPTRWAVFGGSVNFLTSPLATYPLGTAGSVHASVSKELSDKLSVGAGLSAITGSGWGASGELGMVYTLGNIGALKNAKIGFALTGLGRPFTPATEGVKGGKTTGYTSMFTPKTGIAATVVSTENVKIGASADLSAPTFQNVIFDARIEALFKDIVSVKTGWNVNLIETLQKKQTFLPSVSVGVNLKIDSKNKDSFLARNDWGQSDITPTVALKPLHNNIYAMGAGVNVKLGVIDKNPPKIVVTYPEEQYISPNSDGIKDALEFPVSITDQRFILAWSFIIENEAGKVVRTIANKEIRSEMQDLKSVWSQLTKKKEGIALPESLRWDGSMESGDIAPDGTYFFYISAEDDNANIGLSEKFTLHVDNTAPVVTASPPTGTNAMIFSPDGDGNKDTFKIVQTGSVEDIWEANFMTSTGSVVRTIKSEKAEPATFDWDGKSNSGSIVPDGVYSYTIATTDKAGNSVQATIANIIVDTDKPSINISINTNAFSPNADGILDTVTLTPSIPVLTGLSAWEIVISNKAGTAVRTWTGKGSVAPITFDGKTDAGNIASEGEYQAQISARYINGHAPVAKSPLFILDITAPEASVRASVDLFSPVGDGKLDTVTFTQQATTEQSWKGEIFALPSSSAAVGDPIRTYSFGATPEVTIIWDGRDANGKLASDGLYGYRLVSTDRAGNTGFSALAKVELNTEKADLILQANLSAFSPNGDGVKDTIIFTPILKAQTAVARYTLTIADSTKKTVKTISGTGKVPVTFSWNGIADPAQGATTGERSPDGIYTAALEVVLVNQQSSRSQAPDFEIDTVFPSLKMSTPYTVFSPNGDEKKDTLPVSVETSVEDKWTAVITTARNAAIKTLNWTGKAENFVWAATDDSGNKIADGTYAITLSSEDRAGNKTSETISNIVVDARAPKAFITAEHAAFSPNGDTIKDTQKLAIVTSITEGLSAWEIQITSLAAPTVPVRKWDSSTTAVLPAAINWDGKNTAGKITQGEHIAELKLTYIKGDEVRVATPAFLVNAIPPALTVNLAPKYFSPDNDGIEDELFISLGAKSASSFADWSFEIREPTGTNGNIFWRTGGSGRITERIIWDGRSIRGELVQAATDYPFTFTVKDDVGMTSVIKGYIPVDVMVIRDGDKLKIAVPSIIFRENAADFNGLETAVVDKNTQVLRRIAEILNKFKDYRIQVEGHANNVTGTQKEEDTELIPLSQLRAVAVKDFLVRNGVESARLTTIGMGGTRPVAQRSDRENWWKNRRVEFILIK